MLLIILFNIGLSNAQVSISDYHLERLKLFGFSEDTLSDVAVENMALLKMDSILFAETDSHFVDLPHIYYRYSFQDLPCIELYGIRSNKGAGTEYNPYKEMLINKCDSSVYHYEGDLQSFSRVVSKYLETHFDNTGIINVLYLYLNTTSLKSAYYIILSRGDFERFYDDWYRGADTSDQFIKEKRDKNINLAKKYIKNSEIRKQDDKFNAKIYTFNAGKGRLEFWRFNVYPNKIELRDFKILAKEVRIFAPID